MHANPLLRFLFFCVCVCVFVCFYVLLYTSLHTSLCMLRLVMVIGAADSTLQVADIERGELMGKPLRPKTPSSACLCLAALDLEALATGPVQRRAVLSWSVPETVLEAEPGPALQKGVAAEGLDVVGREVSGAQPIPSAFASEAGLAGGRTISFDQGMQFCVCIYIWRHVCLW